MSVADEALCRSLPRHQLHVKVLQPANDKARFVGEIAVPGRTVDLFVEADLAGLGEELLEQDADLDPGQRRPGADVGAPAESKVLVDLVAADGQILWFRPAAWIAVGGGEPDEHALARLDGVVANPGVAFGKAEGALGRAFQAKRFLQEGGNLVRV